MPRRISRAPGIYRWDLTRAPKGYTQGKNRPNASQKSIAEIFDEKIIHVSIYNFSVIEGERPIVKKLLGKQVHDIAFSGSMSSFEVF
jgi:hypothetical protein